MRKETDFIHEKAQDILKQAATGLAFMNAKGWVHRDVKPDNMLVNSAGELKLIDFAIAERIPTGFGQAGSAARSKPQGTRSYMSPEQIRGQALDGRADIYSFGATAFELVTGRPPFRGASSQDLLNKHIKEKPVSPAFYNPDVTKEFGDLVLRMLAKKKEDRPRDFHEVLMAMRTMKVFISRTRPPSRSDVSADIGLCAVRVHWDARWRTGRWRRTTIFRLRKKSTRWRSSWRGWSPPAAARPAAGGDPPHPPGAGQPQEEDLRQPDAVADRAGFASQEPAANDGLRRSDIRGFRRAARRPGDRRRPGHSTGFARLGDFRVLLLGHQKGRTLKEKQECFYGCATRRAIARR